jgi:hypothetical protein
MGWAWKLGEKSQAPPSRVCYHGELMNIIEEIK